MSEAEGRKSFAQYKGKVKWFNNAKGYGFIGREDGAGRIRSLLRDSVGWIQNTQAKATMWSSTSLRLPKRSQAGRSNPESGYRWQAPTIAA